MSQVRISDKRFREKPLRANELFADLAIHDIWAFDLPSGTGQSMLDLRKVIVGSRPFRANWRVSLFFGLRKMLGVVFGWDRQPRDAEKRSLVEELTSGDREKSRVKSGETGGMFRTLYVFENESADEILTKKVHAVSVLAMEPLSEGYTVYWAILLKNRAGAITKAFDHFRSRYIYPAIIDRVRREWVKIHPQEVKRVYSPEKPRHDEDQFGPALGA